MLSTTVAATTICSTDWSDWLILSSMDRYIDRSKQSVTQMKQQKWQYGPWEMITSHWLEIKDCMKCWRVICVQVTKQAEQPPPAKSWAAFKTSGNKPEQQTRRPRRQNLFFCLRHDGVVLSSRWCRGCCAHNFSNRSIERAQQQLHNFISTNHGPTKQSTLSQWSWTLPTSITSASQTMKSFSVLPETALL